MSVLWQDLGGAQERVVCYQQNDTSMLTILQHTPDSYTGHQVYEALLDFMEEGWYFLQVELHA